MKTYINKLIKFYYNGVPKIGFVLEEWPNKSPHFLRILFQVSGEINILAVRTSKPELLEE